jgi:hypothetical protein
MPTSGLSTGTLLVSRASRVVRVWAASRALMMASVDVRTRRMVSSSPVVPTAFRILGIAMERKRVLVVDMLNAI